MQLLKVHVTNYKSIEDSGEFSMKQITCLVGKNESGKTAILQALYKLNPVVDADSKFDAVVDFPRSRSVDYEASLKAGGKAAIVTTTTWELSDEEVEEIDEQFGSGVVKTKIVVVSKGYDNQTYWRLELDEKAAIKKLLDEAAVSAEEKSGLEGQVAVGALLKQCKASASEAVKTFAVSIEKNIPNGGLVSAAIKLLTLPKFVYFESYNRLKGEISVDLLLQKKANPQSLDDRDRIFLSLLEMAGTKLEDLTSVGRFEQFQARLEAAASKITSTIFKYWTQNRHLKVQFLLQPAHAGDPAPMNAGNIFRTRIYNRLHDVSVPFDQRSSGFVWFFSFLSWFSKFEREEQEVIVLLDEPGLTLHIKAQQDLLRYFAEKLAVGRQLVFTTHLPFMIDPANLDAVRIVEDKTTETEPIGTKVSEQFLSKDKDTIVPLQAALGYDIAQTLFIGKNTLLVEGPSDILYLRWASSVLQGKGRPHLGDKWAICPTGGIGNISSFASLFGGNKLNIAVLSDFHSGDKNKIKQLRDSRLLKDGHVFSADELAGQPEADIEDVLGRDFMVSLVNEAYDLPAKNRMVEKRPADAPMLVLTEIQAFFNTAKDVADFDHFTPALYLIEHSGEMQKKLPGVDKALERFEKFFEKIGKLAVK